MYIISLRFLAPPGGSKPTKILPCSAWPRRLGEANPPLLPRTAWFQIIAKKTNKYKYVDLMYIIYMDIRIYIYIYIYSVRRHRLAPPPGGSKPPFASQLRLAAPPLGEANPPLLPCSAWPRRPREANTLLLPCTAWPQIIAKNINKFS
jgi:hypothetical protein